MNQRNFGILEGRLTREPAIWTNDDGSRKIAMTIAVRDNFLSGGERKSQFPSVEAYIPASKADNGVYDHMHKGDMVGIQYSLRTNSYKDKNGEDVYNTVIFVENVDLKESKATTDARAQAAATTVVDPVAATGDTPFAE